MKFSMEVMTLKVTSSRSLNRSKMADVEITEVYNKLSPVNLGPLDFGFL
jgi:hypothetical protein